MNTIYIKVNVNTGSGRIPVATYENGVLNYQGQYLSGTRWKDETNYPAADLADAIAQVEKRFCGDTIIAH